MGAAIASTVSKNLLDGPHVHRNLSTPATGGGGDCARRGESGVEWRRGCADWRTHRPIAARQVSGEGRADRRPRRLGQGEPALSARSLRRAAGAGGAPHAGARPLRAGPVCGRRSALPAAHHHCGGVCVACALREAAFRASAASGAGGARRRIHRHRGARVRSSARTRRHHLFDLHHYRLHAQDRPHRRHEVCGRDEEVASSA